MERNLNKMNEATQVPGKNLFQSEGTEISKTLRQECAWIFPEKASELEQSELVKLRSKKALGRYIITVVSKVFLQCELGSCWRIKA